MKLIMKQKGEVNNFNQQDMLNLKFNKTETDKVSPLREKNIENLSKIQE